VDWGFPKQEEHGHYRVYGGDIGEVLLDEVVGNSCYHRVVIEDTVTSSQDCVYLLSKSGVALEALKKFVF
jgi:hypothetical protein